MGSTLWLVSRSSLHLEVSFFFCLHIIMGYHYSHQRARSKVREGQDFCLSKTNELISCSCLSLQNIMMPLHYYLCEDCLQSESMYKIYRPLVLHQLIWDFQKGALHINHFKSNYKQTKTHSLLQTYTHTHTTPIVCYLHQCMSNMVQWKKKKEKINKIEIAINQMYRFQK